MNLQGGMPGPVPVEGDFAESAPGTLIPVTARDGPVTKAQQSDGATPPLSPCTLGNEGSGDFYDSSPGQLSAPLSPIGPSGHLALHKLLQSSSPRDRNRARRKDSAINILTV